MHGCSEVLVSFGTWGASAEDHAQRVHQCMWERPPMEGGPSPLVGDAGQGPPIRHDQLECRHNCLWDRRAMASCPGAAVENARGLFEARHH